MKLEMNTDDQKKQSHDKNVPPENQVDGKDKPPEPENPKKLDKQKNLDFEKSSDEE